MKLSEYMAAVSAAATGERTGRQMVLAVDCTASHSPASPDDYAIVAQHIENHGASLSPTTVDKAYIGEGETTLKTGTKRTFNVTGQLLRGDDFHDFINSHEIKYGVGSSVQRDYVYFDPGTKKGEKGIVTIAVNKDGAGAASDPGDIDVTLSVVGTPEEFTYTSSSPTQPTQDEGGK